LIKTDHSAVALELKEIEESSRLLEYFFTHQTRVCGDDNKGITQLDRRSKGFIKQQGKMGLVKI